MTDSLINHQSAGSGLGQPEAARRANHTDVVRQSLTQAIQRRLVREVVIRDSRAWERLHERLTLAMSRAWTGQMKEAIAAALDRLRDLGPGAFTQRDGKIILDTMELAVGSLAMRSALRGPVLNLSEGLYRVGRKEVFLSLEVDFKHLPIRDLQALDILKSGNLYWVGNSWNSYTQDLLQGALKDYFDGGMTRERLTARFAEDFSGLSERGQRYWELLADHTATRTREMGRIGAYDQAEIQYVQVRAHIDDNTTEVCKAMHERILPISRLKTQRDDYLAAVKDRNQVAAKNAWRMHENDKGIKGVKTGKLPKHTAMPPYHFRCRTITVAYFGEPK